MRLRAVFLLAFSTSIARYPEDSLDLPARRRREVDGRLVGRVEG